VVRPAVLTAFLGYVLFIVGLLFDLGRPWYIWHQLIYMNPHSVMFEVGMCVMTYTTVLFFEFLPNVFEAPQLEDSHQVD
jgi:Ni/Fe-hydrogenase subunit HybB-like protein